MVSCRPCPGGQSISECVFAHVLICTRHCSNEQSFQTCEELVEWIEKSWKHLKHLEVSSAVKASVTRSELDKSKTTSHHLRQLPQKYEAALAAVGRPRASAADHGVRHLPLQEVVGLPRLLLLLLLLLLLRPLLLPLLLLLLLWQFELCCHCTCLWRQLLLLRWRSWRWR